MKQVLSISLGSSSRDASMDVEIGGQLVRVERIGTDGNKKKARELFSKYDGKVDAFGLGGTDLYIFAGEKPYIFGDSEKIIADVSKTPVLDGSGLKRSLEPYLVEQLAGKRIIDFAGKRVLHMCGVDRMALGQALIKKGAKVTFGDLIYGLGINYPIKSLQSLSFLAGLVVPVITKLPINWFYPTGDGQTKRVVRHPEYFAQNDIIAGDFHFIRRFMPTILPGKIIITNTVTAEDRKFLQAAGIACLITVTPNFQGRSFGTNVLEAILVALKGSNAPLDGATYKRLLQQNDIKPGIEYL
jgi:hypothetical protein